MMKQPNWLICLLLAIAGTCSGQETVPLYLEPDASTAEYSRETVERLQELGPYVYRDPDTPASTDWYWVEYRGVYTGYIPAENVSKAMVVTGNPLVRLRPADEAPVLTRLTEPRRATVTKVDADWATVYFRGSAPAYFTATDYNAARPLTPTASPQEEPVELPEDDEIPISAAPIATDAPELPDGDLRTLTGTLERTYLIDRKLLAGYRYVLKDANGNSLAYVDLSKALGVQRQDQFVGEDVIVEGTTKTLRTPPGLALHARSIRPLAQP